MSSDDKIIKEVAKEVEEIFLYMTKNHLDVKSERDVTKAMKILGKEKTDKKGVRTTIGVLGILQRMVEAELANARSRKTA